MPKDGLCCFIHKVIHLAVGEVHREVDLPLGKFFPYVHGHIERLIVFVAPDVEVVE